MIEFSSLTMRFGELVAVNDLSLKVEQGEFFAYLGPNGAGKTTTIKMLTGLLKPYQGTVKICGIDIQQEPEKAKSKLGYVPDVAIFYEKLNALEFMDFTADIFGVDPEKARRETGELFDKFGLNSYARELIETLSHGTRQRLAIAAALMHDPEVVIIDEPMVGLDPIHAKIVKDELKERSSRGTTVFLSTHQLYIAEELADRVGILNGGKMVALGTIDELKAAADRGETELESIFLDLVAEQVAEKNAAQIPPDLSAPAA